jgi:intraflagellar transport protein 80
MVNGSAVAFAGSHGVVCFGHLIERKIEWSHLEVEILDNRLVSIRDVKNGHEENLDFKDNILHASLSFNTAVILTQTQCHVFSPGKSLNTFDLPDQTGRVICLKQCKHYFVMVDQQFGISVYSYTGRCVSTIKSQRPICSGDPIIALNDEMIAFKDYSNPTSILTFDILTGKPLNTLKCAQEVRQICVDNVGIIKHIAVIDKNSDLWIAQVSRGNFVKIGNMAESICFCEEEPFLASVLDGRITFWSYPGIVFVDEDLKIDTKVVKDSVKNSRLLWFSKSQCGLRKTDGSSMVVGWYCPFAKQLHELASRKQWDVCLKLCRLSNLETLWAILAALALNGNDLNTAEIAYAALEKVHKVHHIAYIREIQHKDLRAAELLVFRRQFKEAEALLLNSRQIFLAIRLWMRIHNWDKYAKLISLFHTVW